MARGVGSMVHAVVNRMNSDVFVQCVPGGDNTANPPFPDGGGHISSAAPCGDGYGARGNGFPTPGVVG